MRQLQAVQHGDPREVLALVDVEDPPLRRDEIRIACSAVGLNFLDVMLCRGTYPAQPPPPVTPGVEVAGRVVEAGAEAGFRVGDTVLACPTMPAGALGERVVVKAALAVAVPSDADPLQLAALPVNYQTAWFSLRRAQVTGGETVLVHAGAGGVGIAATQLATAWGARVICTAGGPRKTRLCLEQGADVAIDYTDEDFVARARELTDGRGVDIVLDPVGGEVFGRSLQCLAFEGRIVPIGAAGGLPDPVDPMALTAANVSVVGLSWGSAYPYRRPDEVRAVYGELVGMLGNQVRPVLDRVVDLAGTSDALGDLEARRTIGKIVVRPEGVVS
jgi:NADPH2:quinone reductase